MMFFEIYLNCDDNGEGGKRYCDEKGAPVVAFSREEADQIVLDLMANDITTMAVVNPVKP